MSLVAYGASDSETSDSEEIRESTSSKSAVADDHISDEDDYKPTRYDHPTSTNSASPTVISATDQESGKNPSTLSDLPAPKKAEFGDVDARDGEDELEDLVKPKQAQLLNAPKPPAPRRVKQPARILIPALSKDENEDESKKLRHPSSAPGKGSGLFSLLPPPVHGAKKELNRLLIPYSLSKKTTQSQFSKVRDATPTTPGSSTVRSDPDLVRSKKHLSAFNALTGYESDSDDEITSSESSSFFTLDSQEEASITSSVVSRVKDPVHSVTTVGSGVALRRLGSSPQHAHNRGDSSHREVTSSETGSDCMSTKTESSVSVVCSDASERLSSSTDDSDATVKGREFGVPVVDQDAPLSFSSASHSRTWSLSPLVSPMTPELYVAPSKGARQSSAQAWQTQQHLAQESASSYTETEETESIDSEEADSSTGTEIQQMFADEQFQRLGGKRKLSLDNIEIIEANVDDQVDPSGLMKGITEESSYQPHRKKDNMPSAQQRRKKQIQYLAFQAKERELELKNMWAENKINKNHLRSKYGF